MVFTLLTVRLLGSLFHLGPSGVGLAKRPPDLSSGKPDKPNLTVEILARWEHRAIEFSSLKCKILAIKPLPFKLDTL